MKKIAIVVPTIRSGGAEKQAVLLAKSLASQNDVYFIVFWGEEQSAKSNEKILEESSIRGKYNLKGNRFKKTIELSKILKTCSVEIVFNYLTFCNVYCAIIEKISGVKYIYNGIRNSRLPFFKLVSERFLHNYVTNGTIFNCYSGADFFHDKGFNNEKSFVIPNCFPDISKQIDRKEKSPIEIITIGRFVAQKDYNTALKTIKRVREICECEMHYNIIGFGVLEEEIRSWIAQYDVKNIVSLYINPSNTQDLLKNSDIYLSTSIFEGTSNSIMEALNWSVPVVATDVGDNSYLVHNGESGFLHSVGDVEGLASSLKILINDSEMRNRMGSKGNEILRNNYSTDLFEKRYKEIVNR